MKKLLLLTVVLVATGSIFAQTVSQMSGVSKRRTLHAPDSLFVRSIPDNPIFSDELILRYRDSLHTLYTYGNDDGSYIEYVMSYRNATTDSITIALRFITMGQMEIVTCFLIGHTNVFI